MHFLAPLFATSLVIQAPHLASRVAPVRAVTPAKMALVDDVKDAVLPSGTDKTLRNVMGLQMTGWGAGCLLAPNWVASTLFAATNPACVVPLSRGMGLVLLQLGAKTVRDSDSDAALQGFIFYGMWYKLITDAVAAGTMAGYGGMIALWNGLCALSCARRMGGLFDTVTKLDMGALSSFLPRDQEVSLRNLVGLQLLGWGLVCTFYQPFFFGSQLINAAGGAMGAIIATGTGLANLLLGAKVFGGSDEDAATNGLLVLGGYGVIGYLAKAAGLFTGSWMTACTAWNLAFAAYCLKEKL